MAPRPFDVKWDLSSTSLSSCKPCCFWERDSTLHVILECCFHSQLNTILLETNRYQSHAPEVPKYYSLAWSKLQKWFVATIDTPLPQSRPQEGSIVQSRPQKWSATIDKALEIVRCHKGVLQRWSDAINEPQKPSLPQTNMLNRVPPCSKRKTWIG